MDNLIQEADELNRSPPKNILEWILRDDSVRVSYPLVLLLYALAVFSGILGVLPVSDFCVFFIPALGLGIFNGNSALVPGENCWMAVCSYTVSFIISIVNIFIFSYSAVLTAPALLTMSALASWGILVSVALIMRASGTTRKFRLITMQIFTFATIFLNAYVIVSLVIFNKMSAIDAAMHSIFLSIFFAVACFYFYVSPRLALSSVVPESEIEKATEKTDNGNDMSENQISLLSKIVFIAKDLWSSKSGKVSCFMLIAWGVDAVFGYKLHEFLNYIIPVLAVLLAMYGAKSKLKI